MPTMRILLCGADTFRSRRKLSALRDRFKVARDAGGLNCLTFRAGTHGVEQAAEALCAVPFLAERKMVVLENYLQSRTQDQEQLAVLLDRIPESTVAVFFEDCSADAIVASPLYSPLRAEKYS